MEILGNGFDALGDKGSERQTGLELFEKGLRGVKGAIVVGFVGVDYGGNFENWHGEFRGKGIRDNGSLGRLGLEGKRKQKN